jgi:hypothetical protein
LTQRSATNAGLQEEDEAKLKNRAMEQQQIEYVTDILTGISQEGSWAPPPEKNDVFAVLPEDAVQKAMEAVTEHATVYWPEPTVLPDFDDITPKDARKFMKRTGYFRYQTPTYLRLYKQWEGLRRKRKRVVVKKIQDLNMLQYSRQPPASELRNLSTAMLNSMKATFAVEAWEVTRTADHEKCMYTGMKHETTDVLQDRLMTEHSRQTATMKQWDEMTFELTDQDLMLRSLGKLFDCPIVDVESIFEDFRKVDTDGSGFLDQEEFRTMLMTMHNGMEPTKTQLRNAFDLIDEDGSGTIDFPEFFCWYAANYLTFT